MGFLWNKTLLRINEGFVQNCQTWCLDSGPFVSGHFSRDSDYLQLLISLKGFNTLFKKQITNVDAFCKCNTDV